MAGDFFAEPYNVVLFVSVLGTLTIMMSGCYIYHKWQHVKDRNTPDLVVRPKPRKRLRKFLRRASSSASGKARDSDIHQMELESRGGDFTSHDDVLGRRMSNLEDDVFGEVLECQSHPRPVETHMNSSSKSVSESLEEIKSGSITK